MILYYVRYKNPETRTFKALAKRLKKFDIVGYPPQKSRNIIKVDFTGINYMELIIGSFYYISTIKTLVAMQYNHTSILKHCLTCKNSILYGIKRAFMAENILSNYRNMNLIKHVQVISSIG